MEEFWKLFLVSFAIALAVCIPPLIAILIFV